MAPPSDKQWDLSVVVPVPDMTELGGPSEEGAAAPTIWPHVEERIVDLIGEHRSTLVDRIVDGFNEPIPKQATGMRPENILNALIQRRIGPCVFDAGYYVSFTELAQCQR